jgi:hypothetical protein
MYTVCFVCRDKNTKYLPRPGEVIEAEGKIELGPEHVAVTYARLTA